MSERAAIVIVEDEFIVALDIQRHLERNGYEVKGIFPSGEELLAKVEELHPDLVLMDIRLQGALDGVETSALLNDKYSVPVILLTAYADEATLARAKITQPFGYLLKPFEERELRTSIEIALYRSKMERRLRESERLLRQAQKMEAVGRLAGGIAHDFNNILTAILGYANLLSEEVGEDSVMREDVEGVKKAARRAEVLTRQLLAFSKRQPMEPRVIDPCETLREMERMLQRLLPSKIALSLRAGDDSLRIKMDPSQFERILLNLIVNARDAILEGGNIFVGLSSFQIRDAYIGTLESIPTGDFIALTVQDNGLGIPAENYEKIFEPFFTTKAKEGGTGFGLATVYGIVKQSNGYLDLESRVGSGTTFTLLFPRYSGDGAKDVASEDRPKEAVGTETVLIVEDDDQIRNLMEHSLAKRGFDVLSSSHPGEALLIAEKVEYRLDLIIADVGLPFMTGIELTERMRKSLPSLKVLFVSGYPERAPDIRNSAFLPKPFTEEVLSSTVRILLDSTPT